MLDLAALNNLSDAEARKLYTTLAFRFSAKKSHDFTAEERMIYELIKKHVAGHARIAPLEIAVNAQGVGIGNYCEKVADLFDLIRLGSDKLVRRPVRYAIADLMIECLAEDLQERGVALSFRSIVTNLSRARSVFEANFPGYISARILHRTIQAAA